MTSEFETLQIRVSLPAADAERLRRMTPAERGELLRDRAAVQAPPVIPQGATIPEQVRDYMRRRGITQHELAERVDRTRPAVFQTLERDPIAARESWRDILAALGLRVQVMPDE